MLIFCPCGSAVYVLASGRMEWSSLTSEESPVKSTGYGGDGTVLFVTRLDFQGCDVSPGIALACSVWSFPLIYSHRRPEKAAQPSAWLWLVLQEYLLSVRRNHLRNKHTELAREPALGLHLLHCGAPPLARPLNCSYDWSVSRGFGARQGLHSHRAARFL